MNPFPQRFGRVSENEIARVFPRWRVRIAGRAKEKWKARWGDKRGRKIARAENGAISEQEDGERKLANEKKGWSVDANRAIRT